jgi:non-homologous end joining protein Ku
MVPREDASGLRSDELESVKAEANRKISSSKIRAAGEREPVNFESSYYLEPAKYCDEYASERLSS